MRPRPTTPTPPETVARREQGLQRRERGAGWLSSIGFDAELYSFARELAASGRRVMARGGGRPGQPARLSDDASSRPSIVRRRRRRPGVEGDRGGEHLAGDVGLVLAGGVEQLGVAAEGQLDPVGDLQAGLFAGVLDGVDDLAGEALAAKLVVELELQGDGMAGLRLDLVALERLQGESRPRPAPSVWSSPSMLIPTSPPSRSPRRRGPRRAPRPPPRPGASACRSAGRALR